MKTHFLFAPNFLGLLLLLSGAIRSNADITMRVSVKFILKPDGTRPAAGDIGTQDGFEIEINRGNEILGATGRGYRVQVVEYLDIRPSPPAGQAADYWYSLDARANRQTIENAATASASSMMTWLWNENAINIYVNNSSSGQCSFVGGGSSISLGNDIGTGTVLHELGHFFDLRHTHGGDYNGMVGEWSDGDSLSETLPDDPDASPADINALYPNEIQQKRDDLIFNVMSYHNEDRLLGVQMDICTANANQARLGFCDGRTWFVASGGSDGSAGSSASALFATLSRALTSVTTANDVVLLRSGIYSSPPNRVISRPCTLRATRGAVTVQ